eukprot:6205251-Pleurochrysis_carterae.AAC.2
MLTKRDACSSKRVVIRDAQLKGALMSWSNSVVRAEFVQARSVINEPVNTLYTKSTKSDEALV